MQNLRKHNKIKKILQAKIKQILSKIKRVESQNTKIRKELIGLLDELNIENFTLNTEEKKLTIHYKEDFDLFFPKLNGIPECFRDSEKFLPYSATHYAFFEYAGWDIRGNIINHKANLSAKK